MAHTLEEQFVLCIDNEGYPHPWNCEGYTVSFLTCRPVGAIC